MDYIILKIKKQIIDLIAQAIEVDFDLHKLEVVVPPDSMMGDLAVPCFYLSKITTITKSNCPRAGRKNKFWRSD